MNIDRHSPPANGWAVPMPFRLGRTTSVSAFGVRRIAVDTTFLLVGQAAAPLPADGVFSDATVIARQSAGVASFDCPSAQPSARTLTGHLGGRLGTRA